MTKDEALKLCDYLECNDASMEAQCKAAAFIRKALAQPEQEPWSPVSIGVDITEEGAHVVGIYALDKDTSQIFYAKHHPAPQRTWVGLTEEDWNRSKHNYDFQKGVDWAEAMLKEKNT